MDKHNSVCLFVCLFSCEDLTPSHEAKYRHIIYQSTQNLLHQVVETISIGQICQARGQEIEP